MLNTYIIDILTSLTIRIQLYIVYNTPLYHLLFLSVLYYCILLLNCYRITINVLLFSSRTSEGIYFSA